MKNKAKVLFLVADDRYFYTHRLELAVSIRDKGYEVYIACPLGKYVEIFKKKGFNFIEISFNRRSINPFKEFKTIWDIQKIYSDIRPDIVHQVALKPSLYGTMVARLLRVPKIINAVSGLGHNFTSEGLWLIRFILKLFLRLFWCGSSVKVIVQNPDDFQELAKLIPETKLFLILSAGVNTDFFTYEPEPKGKITITHLSRMLWTKGVGELVEASKILKNQDYDVCIQLVGDSDIHNPSSISPTQLQAWHDRGGVKWLGFREDTADIYKNTHIVVLATYYREGVPKSLTEALACGRPIITSDMPGCREVVQNGENGFLVQPKNSFSLAEALKILIENPELRKKMGKKSREICLKKFDSQHIIKETMKLYI